MRPNVTPDFFQLLTRTHEPCVPTIWSENCWFGKPQNSIRGSLAEARRQDKNFTSTADKRVEARSANKFDGNKGRLKVEIRRQASGTRYESGWDAISRGGGERCGGLCVINV